MPCLNELDLSDNPGGCCAAFINIPFASLNSRGRLLLLLLLNLPGPRLSQLIIFAFLPSILTLEPIDLLSTPPGKNSSRGT